MSLGLLNNIACYLCAEQSEPDAEQPAEHAAAAVVWFAHQLRRRRRGRPCGRQRPGRQRRRAEPVGAERQLRHLPAADRRRRAFAGDQPAQPRGHAGHRSGQRHAELRPGQLRQPGVPEHPDGDRQHRLDDQLQRQPGLLRDGEDGVRLRRHVIRREVVQRDGRRTVGFGHRCFGAFAGTTTPGTTTALTNPTPTASTTSAGATATFAALGAGTDTISGTLSVSVAGGTAVTATIASGTTLAAAVTQLNAQASFSGQA